MKKYGMLLCVLLTMALTVPCLAESTPAPEAPTFEWERDAAEHWHVREDGERADVAAHTLTDDLCEVCGSTVLTDENGWTEVSNENEHGDLIRSTSYAPDGTVMYDCKIDYGYDENGNMVWERDFDGDTLLSEATYSTDADGLHRLIATVSYNEEGYVTRADYGSSENVSTLRTYAADGTLVYEETNEYELNDEGWYYLVKTTAKLEDGTILLSEFNDHGDWVRAAIIDADGNLTSDTTYEYVYVDDVKSACMIYDNGVLTMEETYDENGWLILEIEHSADGTTHTYEYHYDENGELID